MRYISSPSNDAFFNMALEEYVFEALPRDEEWFMLWQNRRAIVVGKFQNVAQEINAEYVRQNDIQVVRRLSGGGAMYQDMGNLNFTFVVDRGTTQKLDFAVFTQPMVAALRQMGVPAETGDRNDILIEGKKFSGNSQYNKGGRTMHHGTLLYSSDLDGIGKALNVPPDKIESKGVKSVRSRVTNIADHLPQPMPLQQFKDTLLQNMFQTGNLHPYVLSARDMAQVQQLCHEKYATWQWTWGNSPAYSIQKYRRFPFGGVTVQMDVGGGSIQAIAFSGDFFGNGAIEELQAALAGTTLRADALQEALAALDVGDYIKGCTAQQLAALLME